MNSRLSSSVDPSCCSLGRSGRLQGTLLMHRTGERTPPTCRRRSSPRRARASMCIPLRTLACSHRERRVCRGSSSPPKGLFGRLDRGRTLVMFEDHRRRGSSASRHHQSRGSLRCTRGLMSIVCGVGFVRPRNKSRSAHPFRGARCRPCLTRTIHQGSGKSSCIQSPLCSGQCMLRFRRSRLERRTVHRVRFCSRSCAGSYRRCDPCPVMGRGEMV